MNSRRFLYEYFYSYAGALFSLSSSGRKTDFDGEVNSLFKLQTHRIDNLTPPDLSPQIIIFGGGRSPGGVRLSIRWVWSLTLPVIFEIPHSRILNLAQHRSKATWQNSTLGKDLTWVSDRNENPDVTVPAVTIKTFFIIYFYYI